MKPGGYARVFGAGPRGAAASVALLAAAAWTAGRTPELSFGLGSGLRIALGAAGAGAAISLIVWSVRTLPVGTRGRELVTAGPFQWVRHPLYAAFLSLFNPALAVALDHPAFLVWALALHPLWHRLIQPEEMLMVGLFGDDYRRYAARTGRFLPRLGRPPGSGRDDAPAR